MDEKQFSDIYKDYAPDLYRFCMFKVSNRQEAEDLTSEVFVDLYKQDLEEIGHVRGWLYKVARNKIYDHYNKSMKNDDSEVKNVSELTHEQFISTLKSTENIAIDSSMVNKIESELKNLDENTSEIIILRLWNDLSFDEIAQITKLGLSSVKMKFYRGVDQIKASLSMQVKNEKSYKLNSFAFIFAGVIGISFQPAYAFSAVGASLSAGIGSILGINLGNMAIAETTAVAATASTKTGIAGFLSTAAGKAVVGVVATATVITGGVGGYALTQNSNDDVQEPEMVEEVEPEVIESNFITYTNENYPEFSFVYDENEWEISEGLSESIEEDVADSTLIILENSEGKINIDLVPVGMFGIGNEECYAGQTIGIERGSVGVLGIVENDGSWFYTSYTDSEGSLNYCTNGFFIQSTPTNYLDERDFVETDILLNAIVTISYEGENTDEFIEFLESVSFEDDQISEYEQNSFKFEELGFSIDLPEQESYDYIRFELPESNATGLPEEWFLNFDILGIEETGSIHGKIEYTNRELIGNSAGRYFGFPCGPSCGEESLIEVYSTNYSSSEEVFGLVEEYVEEQANDDFTDFNPDFAYVNRITKFGIDNVIEYDLAPLIEAGQGRNNFIVEKEGKVYIVSGYGLDDPEVAEVLDTIRFK